MRTPPVNPCFLALTILVVALALCCGSADAGCQPCNGCSESCIECVPDLPCEGQANPLVTLPSCSLLIPMDHLSNQGDPNAAGNAYGTVDVPSDNFNFKTYGLLVRLLYADIPLRWVIRDDKARSGVFTDVDVRKNVSMVYPSAGTPVLRDFTSGLFVVEVEYRTTAEQVIEEYNADQVAEEQVVVYELLEEQPAEADLSAGLAPGFLFPLAHNVNRKPFVAVFDSAPDAFWIQLQYLELSGLVRNATWDQEEGGDDAPAVPWDERAPKPAGIHYTLLAKDDARTFSDEICLTFVSEPHFAANSTAEARDFVRVARAFAKKGGNVFFQCTGISTYENCVSPDNPCTDEDTYGFLTTEGVYESGTPPDVSSYHHASLPHLQFDDAWNSQGGNIARFGTEPTRGGAETPALVGTALRDSDDQKSVWNIRGWVDKNDDTAGEVAMVASGRVDRAAPQGHNFYMMAGHSYANAKGSTDPLSEPGVRVYMNAVLVPSDRPAVCGFNIPDATPPSGKRRRLVHRAAVPGPEPSTAAIRGAPEPRGNGGVVLCGCGTYYDACGECGGEATECGDLGACCSLSGCENWVEAASCSGDWVAGGNCFVTPGLCEAFSGGQDGTPEGGCCDGTRCFEDTLMGCTQPGHHYLGDGVPCAPGVCEEGSCCRAEGGCEDGVLEADCSGIDERFNGARTRCRDLGDECRRGACCHRATGICEHLHDSNCDAEGDVFHGRGSLCTAVTCSTSSPDASVGACCASVSLTTCILVDGPESCASGAGEFHGLGTHCTADTCQLATGGDEGEEEEEGGGGDGGDDSGTIAVGIGAALAGCTLLMLVATIVAAVGIGAAVLISMRVRRRREDSVMHASDPWTN